MSGFSGGVNLPAQWTVAESSTNHGSLDIQTDATSSYLRLRIDSDHNATIDAAVDSAGGGAKDAVINIEADGGGAANLFVTNHTPAGESATLAGEGALSLFTTAGIKGIEGWNADGTVLEFALLPSGQIMTGAVAVAADGDLAANQVSISFDPTNAAAALKLKGKTANGTVVTATIPMAHVQMLGYVTQPPDGAAVKYDQANRALASARQNAVADLNLGALTLLTDTITALGTVQTKVNAVLAALRSAGVLAA